MNVDVAFAPEEVNNLEITEKSILIVDILRATSTITTAIANGSAFIIPVNTPKEAFDLYKEYDGNTILGGEVDGKRVNGFHLGNSLSEYTESVVKDNQIIFRTTNGTKAINAFISSKNLVIGSFLNQTAVCNHLLKLGNDILIVCSGKEGRFGMEDAVFAGACVSSFGENISKTDSAVAVEILYQAFKTDILQMLRDSEHGRYLINIGLEDDLYLCSQVDITTVIPIYEDGKIIRYS
ncbi:TPA: 2-phosphosulfolactate phosphatase [bacterium]|nr:2-phosphosulfolactate phosphatase [bacterium]